MAAGRGKNPGRGGAPSVDLARAAREGVTVPLRAPNPNVQAYTASADGRTQLAAWPHDPTQPAQKPSRGSPPRDIESRRKRVKRSWVVAAVVAVVALVVGASVYLLNAHTSTRGAAPTAAPPPAPSAAVTT